MIINSCSNNVKTAVLLICLLTLSGVIQAESSVAVSQPEAAAVNDAMQQRGDDFPKWDFPKWPDKGPIRKERVPPPPPGPYMSSALSEYSFEGPSFASKLSDPDEPEAAPDKAGVSMQLFSPDVPWPSNDSAPHRWEPKNGYQYVEPGTEDKVYTSRSRNSRSNYNFGYGGYPVMNRPAAGWMPSMSGRGGNNYSPVGGAPAAGSSVYGGGQGQTRQ